MAKNEATDGDPGAAPSEAATLVSIPASNYVEKARWALRLAGVPFVEEKWAPLFAYASTMPKGGKTVPLLALPASPKVALTDSADIMDYCARVLPSLYANEDARRLEALYDAKLGPHARRCAYFVLFQNLEAAWKVLADPLAGFVQYSLLWLSFPVLKAMLLRALNVNEKSAERSWSKLEALLDEAEQRLGDGPVGSRFLAGDTLTAADISLCAHVSLLIFPPEHEYIGPYMSVDKIENPVFRARFEKLLRSKIGQYVLWCYKNKRPHAAIRSKL